MFPAQLVAFFVVVEKQEDLKWQTRNGTSSNRK